MSYTTFTRLPLVAILLLEIASGSFVGNKGVSRVTLISVLKRDSHSSTTGFEAYIALICTIQFLILLICFSVLLM